MLDNHSISGVHLCPVFLTDRCFKPWPGDVLDISSTISCISLLGPQLVSKQFKQTWKGEGGGDVVAVRGAECCLPTQNGRGLPVTSKPSWASG